MSPAPNPWTFIMRYVSDMREHSKFLADQLHAAELINTREFQFMKTADRTRAWQTFLAPLDTRNLESAVVNAAGDRAENLAYKANNLTSMAGIYVSVFSDFAYTIGTSLYKEAMHKNPALRAREGALSHPVGHEFTGLCRDWTENAPHISYQDNDACYKEFENRWIPAMYALKEDVRMNDKSGNRHEITGRPTEAAIKKFKTAIAQYVMEIMLPLDSFGLQEPAAQKAYLAGIVDGVDIPSATAVAGDLFEASKKNKGFTRVEDLVLPFAEAIVGRKAEKAGLDALMAYDAVRACSFINQSQYFKRQQETRLATYLTACFMSGKKIGLKADSPVISYDGAFIPILARYPDILEAIQSYLG